MCVRLHYTPRVFEGDGFGSISLTVRGNGWMDSVECLTNRTQPHTHANCSFSPGKMEGAPPEERNNYFIEPRAHARGSGVSN